MKPKNKAHINTIWGKSTSGRTTLAKEVSNSKAIYLDMLEHSVSDSYVENFDNLISNYKSSLVSKLKYIDHRIEDIFIKSNDEFSILFIKMSNGDEVPYYQANIRVYHLLNIINLIRHKKDLIVDNFDVLYSGFDFMKVANLIIKEIFYNHAKVTFVFNHLSVFQQFSLHIGANLSKNMYLCKYDWKAEKYEHLEISYNELAYTLNMMYNKEISKHYNNAHNGDDIRRPSDAV